MKQLIIIKLFKTLVVEWNLNLAIILVCFSMAFNSLTLVLLGLLFTLIGYFFLFFNHFREPFKFQTLFNSNNILANSTTRKSYKLQSDDKFKIY
jgi:hypothetical protein